MKIGDLVKHPQGMINVCDVRYSCGLILETEMVGPGTRLTQWMNCLVWWRGTTGPVYAGADQLEVINESR